MRLAKFLGQIVIFIGSMTLLTALSLFVTGAYLMTWPLMRVSPRDRRLQALVGAGIAVMALARAYGLDKQPSTEEEQ